MTKLFRVLILFLVFLGIGTSCASAANVISFNPQTVEVDPVSSQNVQIIMDQVPDGLSGFNITISILDPEIAEITAVSFPSWNTMPESSTIPSSSVWIKALDPLKKVNSGDTNVLLGTITVTGKKAGSTNLDIPTTRISADGGSLITPVVNTGTVRVSGNEDPVDDEDPVINSVSLSDSTPETGNTIVVTVDVTDNVGVSSVTASGVSLANTGGNIWKGNIVALEGTHSVSVSAMDEAGNVANDNSASYTAITPDNLPPASITGLQSTKGTTWIKWTWQNPKDTDFDHTEIYLNGAYKTSTSSEYFNATGLQPETSYTIGTRTVDTNGNMNKMWVNQTVVTEKEFVPEIKLPVADFTADPTEGYAPLSVQFTDMSENAVSFNWDFGDGTGSTEQNPVHTYSTAGIYTVNLTASNENGMNSKLATINVTERTVSVLPVANFTANVTEGFTPLSVQFTDLSENAISWSWDFGDGDNSTEKNPIHTYYTAGIYTVNLTVSNENGMNSKLATINVTEKTVSVLPVANFTANVTEGFAPLSVQFTDLSENAVSFNWDFGDGTGSTEQNPVHTYFTVGKYNVTLTVANEMDNNTLTKYDYIYVKEASEDDNEENDDDNEVIDDENDNVNDDEDNEETCEDDKETCGETKPVCEETKPACGETKPACGETKPACGETKPACKETKPVCKETKPVCKETKPVCKETKPVCKETKPACEETKPVYKETKPVCKETKPVCEDTKEVNVETGNIDENEQTKDKECPDENVNKDESDEGCPDSKPVCKETKPASEDSKEVNDETESVDKNEQIEDKESSDVNGNEPDENEGRQDNENVDEDESDKGEGSPDAKPVCKETKPVREDTGEVKVETGNADENKQTENENKQTENENKQTEDENKQTEDEGCPDNENEPDETANGGTEKV
ncbi:PKD domain-containing protein [Methanosarcina hadiensis]|uniref:PKD domain-containing protein n=1 Tax=Methanosarcina hadiensis TaxID=3078083 RepID=UPI0039776177